MRRSTPDGLALLALCLLCLPAYAAADVLPVTSGLRLWLRADADVYEDIDGLDPAEDGDGVAHWDDQLVAGENTVNHFAKAASASRQPTYRAGAINGLPAVQFINEATNTQDDFMNGDGGSPLTSGTSGRTVFVVARHDGGSESSPSLIELNAQAGSTSAGSQYRVTAEVGVRVNGGYRIFDEGLSTNLFRLATVQTPDSPDNTTPNTRAWLDGTAMGVSSTLSQTVNTGAAGYRLAAGAGSNPGGSLSGQIAEVLVYEEALADGDREAVEEYLMSKYRLRTQAIPDAAKPVKVFLLAGQSNMSGRGAVGGVATLRPDLDAPQTDVVHWHNRNNPSITNSGWETLATGQGASSSEIGPELSLGRALAEAYPDYQVALLKYSEGATNLDAEWDPKDAATTAYMYNGLLESMGNALGMLAADGLSFEVAGLFWMQGERDSRFADMAGRYEANLVDLIAAVRAQTGQADLPFVIGRVADDLHPGDYPELGNVRAAQAAVAASDDLVALVDTDAFGMNSDDLHFSTAGQLALGEAFAEAYLAIPEPGTALLLALGAVAGLARRRRT